MPDLTQEGLAARGLRVRDLGWVKHPTKDIWRTNTMIGDYKVFGIGPTPSWDFDSATEADDRTSRSAASTEAAKAAAQADYAARILAALEDTGEPALIREAEARGMERAADICEGIRTRIANGPMPEGARFDYEQAIRAEAAAHRKDKEPK